MQLYRQGNYIIRKSRYNETIQVWNMRTMVEEFETFDAAVSYVKNKMKVGI